MAGLEIRCRIELALLDATRRQGGPTAVADPVAADFGHLLDPALGGVIARDFLPVETSDREADGEREEGPSPLAGKRVAAALLPALADPRRYRVGALPGKGPVYLVCQDMAGGWWALGEYRDVAEAVDMTDRLVAATDFDRRLLHIVEWTLLRSARHHRQDGTDRDDRGLDFSFRVSAVLPRGDEGEDRRWREGARGIVRDNIPAHVGVDMLFLGRRRMRHFRRLYDAWREALRHGPPERRARASRHLERFLRHERPPVPPPPPPPDPILAFAIAADPVVPGSPVTFTLSWKVTEGATFRSSRTTGRAVRAAVLPVPVSGAGKLPGRPPGGSRSPTRSRSFPHEGEAPMPMPSARATAAITLCQPAGSVISYMGTAATLAGLAPLGWLPCDGSSLSAADFPELFAAIGTHYGGDGNPRFNLPDLRGMFLRSVDPDGRNDPDFASRTSPVPGDETVVGPRGRQPRARRGAEPPALLGREFRPDRRLGRRHQRPALRRQSQAPQRRHPAHHQSRRRRRRDPAVQRLRLFPDLRRAAADTRGVAAEAFTSKVIVPTARRGDRAQVTRKESSEPP
jgi:hypothetical protein